MPNKQMRNAHYLIINLMLIYQNYFCIYNYFIFKTLTILQT